MIKINLIPVKERAKQKEVFFVVCTFVFFVFCFLIMSWFFMKKKGFENDLKNQIKQVEQESAGYKEKEAEIKNLEDNESSLDSMKKSIFDISETQKQVIVAVDQIASSLPDGVWLTRIVEGDGQNSSQFIIDGYALTQRSLEKYFSSIQANPCFSGAVLDIKSISVSMGNNRQVSQFEIITKVIVATL